MLRCFWTDDCALLCYNSSCRPLHLLPGSILIRNSIPEPPSSYLSFLRALVTVRKFVLIHLCLPRLRPKVRRSIIIPTFPNIPGAAIRLRPRKYSVRPWYNHSTIWSRFGPSAWLTQLQGGILPGDDGDMYFPYGFVADELGPAELRGRGEAAMMHDKVRLRTLFQYDGPVFATVVGKITK